jgi:hypothetical protein
VKGTKSPAGVWGTLPGRQVIPSFSFLQSRWGGKEEV